MKQRAKHLMVAAIFYWIVQLGILVSGYTNARVIVQIYLPVFVICALLLLLNQLWLGHGIWIAAAAGLAVEWLGRGSGAGGTNATGIVLNIGILVMGTVLSVFVQVAANKRRKKKQRESAGG